MHYSGDSSTPEMVALENDPSVMVVANADEPIFFTENTYYLYRNDHWYRSPSHRGDWKRVETPPDHVRRIEQPRTYVHYRHNPGANPPRTTFNQRDQVPPPRPDQDQDHPATAPREPNPPTPAQPYANPLPPQQVPPSPDNTPILEGPRDPRDPRNPQPPVSPPPKGDKGP